MNFNLAKFKVMCVGRRSLNLYSAMGPKLVGTSWMELSESSTWLAWGSVYTNLSSDF